MSDTFHLLLEAEPCLEGNAADSKADNNLARYLACSILEGRQAPYTTNMTLDRLKFLEKFLPQCQWLHWADKQGRVASGR